MTQTQVKIGLVDDHILIRDALATVINHSTNIQFPCLPRMEKNLLKN